MDNVRMHGGINVNSPAFYRIAWRITVNPDTGCWLFPYSVIKPGYGTITLKGKTLTAHRVAYAHYFGAIPVGKWVLHRCDVRTCVCPDHLFLGTCSDNQKDMAAKGRHATFGRTSCAHGHEFTPGSYWKYDGKRYCKQCRANQVAARRQKAN